MTISRLKKVALMTPDMFENTVDQISDEGRAILKAIEDYKFHINQTLRIVQNDKALSNVIMEKKKNLDHAAQDLYNIVFEIENIDITEAYNEQQQDIENEKNQPKPDFDADDSNELPKDNESQTNQSQVPSENSNNQTSPSNKSSNSPSNDNSSIPGTSLNQDKSNSAEEDNEDAKDEDNSESGSKENEIEST